MAFRESIAGRVLLALLIAGAFTILVGLGNWQLERLEWKEGLIAAAQARPDEPAVPAPGPDAWDSFDIGQWNYRRVSLTGTFADDEVYAWTVLSEPRGPRGGPGYYVMAHLTTAQGWHVFVNRGFVPEAAMKAEDRPWTAAPDGPVTVEGVVRRDNPPSFVTPDPDPQARTVHTRHVAAMARMLDVPASRTAPYTVDLVAAETPPSGLPQAGEWRVNFPNNHLGYAITWYGLAACLAGVVLASLAGRGTTRSASRRGGVRS